MNKWKAIAISVTWAAIGLGIIAIATFAQDGDNAAAFGIVGGLLAVWVTYLILEAKNR